MSNFWGNILKKNNIFLSIFILYLILCIILSPSKFIQAMLNGISVWTFNVLPAILPFMILTSLLMKLNFLQKISAPLSTPFSKIYRTSPHSGYVFLLSILSGYPIGSKMIAELYEGGQISQTDAFKMSSFCSNSGPMFIIGSVGVGMLLSKTAGYILFLSHILSALINGLIYKRLKDDNKYHPTINTTESSLNFSEIITSSIQGILNIAVIISLFFVITESLYPILNLLPKNLIPLFKGLLEMTQGCLEASKTLPIKWSLPLCSLLISFGGISTILQSVVLLKRVNMPIKLFTLQKFTQGLISFLITLVFSLLIFS